MLKKNKRKKFNILESRIFKFIESVCVKIKSMFNTVKTKFILFSRFLSRKFEDIFNENKFSAIVSAILAILASLSIYSSYGFNITKQVAYIIKDKDVVVQYDKDKFVVDGIQEKVNVALSGDEASIQMAKNNKNLQVVLNLNNLTTGIHNVKLSVENINSNVQAYPIPSSLEVNIQNKDFKAFPIQNEVINKSYLDNIVIQNVELNSEEINVSGSIADLSRVSFVKALIDGKIVKESIKGNADTVYEGIAPVVAYDEQGNKLEKVIPVDEGIGYKLHLKPVSKKLINDIRIKTKGTVPVGQAIKLIDVKNTLINIYGRQEELDKVDHMNVTYDLNKIKDNGTIEGIVEVPANVNLNNFTPKRIISNIQLGPEVSTKININSINLINTNNNLFNYETINNSNPVMIDIYGTQEQIVKVPQLLQQNEIKLTVDVSNVSEGEHELPINIVIPNVYRCTLSQDKIRIKVQKN